MTAKMPDPVVLEGDSVRLAPLTLDHVPDLYAAGGGDEEVWRWRSSPMPASEAGLRRQVAGLLGRPETVQFAVILRETGRAIGSTGFWDVGGFDTSVEIGSTWYGRAYWRTAVNTECKVLLLDHAFHALGFSRVVLKTDILNLRSQAAIERIGGVREGTLRRQYRRPDGTWRDSAYYSILDDEWPSHRARLTDRPRPA
ncbi:GNAT family N-acetyltransferase [Planotetraspora sp. A-T 1434]|uniref:GNAT family N-acetyltransferase n=1 Tax=Planotetraspora sp. A-T 1434 TaxID=2979219 RepID=UPI0021C02C79|nr:GNAT family protein [Planotetraspora sp. A-T 1434]MCT9930970.1 GNAT family N-acetyltransferase [Planotetraspora sp. A-T 1434]